MIGGNIHFGSGGCAGEIGYSYSTPEEFRGSAIEPYQFGCLEQWISGKALQERGVVSLRENARGKIAELAEGKTSLVTGKTVFDAYQLGDTAARAIIEEAFGYLNQALCNMINLLAPELVIFGGGFSRAGEVLIDLISADIRDRVLVMPRLVVSELKNEASLIGGIHYLIENTDFLTEL
jgi:glucokinase